MADQFASEIKWWKQRAASFDAKRAALRPISFDYLSSAYKHSGSKNGAYTFDSVSQGGDQDYQRKRDALMNEWGYLNDTLLPGIGATLYQNPLPVGGVGGKRSLAPTHPSQIKPSENVLQLEKQNKTLGDKIKDVGGTFLRNSLSLLTRTADVLSRFGYATRSILQENLNDYKNDGDITTFEALKAVGKSAIAFNPVTVTHGLATDNKEFKESASAAWAGLSGKNKVWSADLIKDIYPEWTSDHKKWTTALGFAADIGTDPLTYMTLGEGVVVKTAIGGTAKVLGKKALADSMLNATVWTAVGRQSGKNALTDYIRLKPIKKPDARYARAQARTNRLEQRVERFVDASKPVPGKLQERLTRSEAAQQLAFDILEDARATSMSQNFTNLQLAKKALFNKTLGMGAANAFGKGVRRGGIDGPAKTFLEYSAILKGEYASRMRTGDMAEEYIGYHSKVAGQEVKWGGNKKKSWTVPEDYDDFVDEYTDLVMRAIPIKELTRAQVARRNSIVHAADADALQFNNAFQRLAREAHKAEKEGGGPPTGGKPPTTPPGGGGGGGSAAPPTVGVGVTTVTSDADSVVLNIVEAKNVRELLGEKWDTLTDAEKAYAEKFGYNPSMFTYTHFVNDLIASGKPEYASIAQEFTQDVKAGLEEAITAGKFKQNKTDVTMKVDEATGLPSIDSWKPATRVGRTDYDRARNREIADIIDQAWQLAVTKLGNHILSNDTTAVINAMQGSVAHLMNELTASTHLEVGQFLASKYGMSFLPMAPNRAVVHFGGLRGVLQRVEQIPEFLARGVKTNKRYKEPNLKGENLRKSITEKLIVDLEDAVRKLQFKGAPALAIGREGPRKWVESKSNDIVSELMKWVKDSKGHTAPFLETEFGQYAALAFKDKKGVNLLPDSIHVAGTRGGLSGLSISEAAEDLLSLGAKLIDDIHRTENPSISQYSLLDHWLYGENAAKEMGMISTMNPVGRVKKDTIGRLAHMAEAKDEAFLAGVKETMPLMDEKILEAMKVLKAAMANEGGVVSRPTQFMIRRLVTKMLTPDFHKLYLLPDGTMARTPLPERAMETLGWHLDMLSSTTNSSKLSLSARAAIAREVWSTPVLFKELNQSLMLGSLNQLAKGKNTQEAADFLASVIAKYPRVEDLLKASKEAGVTTGTNGARRIKKVKVEATTVTEPPTPTPAPPTPTPAPNNAQATTDAIARAKEQNRLELVDLSNTHAKGLNDADPKTIKFEDNPDPKSSAKYIIYTDAEGKTHKLEVYLDSDSMEVRIIVPGRINNQPIIKWNVTQDDLKRASSSYEGRVEKLVLNHKRDDSFVPSDALLEKSSKAPGDLSTNANQLADELTNIDSKDVQITGKSTDRVFHVNYKIDGKVQHVLATATPHTKSAKGEDQVKILLMERDNPTEPLVAWVVKKDVFENNGMKTVLDNLIGKKGKKVQPLMKYRHVETAPTAAAAAPTPTPTGAGSGSAVPPVPVAAGAAPEGVSGVGTVTATATPSLNVAPSDVPSPAATDAAIEQSAVFTPAAAASMSPADPNRAASSVSPSPKTEIEGEVAAATAENPSGGFTTPTALDPATAADVETVSNEIRAGLNLPLINEKLEKIESSLTANMFEYTAKMKEEFGDFHLKTGRMLRVAGMPIMPMPMIHNPFRNYAGIVGMKERQGRATNWTKDVVIGKDSAATEYLEVNARRPSKSLDPIMNEIRRSRSNTSREMLVATHTVIRDTYFKYKNRAQLRADVKVFFQEGMDVPDGLKLVEDRLKDITNTIMTNVNGVERKLTAQIEFEKQFNRALPKKYRLPVELFEDKEFFKDLDTYSREWLIRASNWLELAPGNSIARNHPLNPKNMNKLNLGDYEFALHHAKMRLDLNLQFHNSMFDEFTFDIDAHMIDEINKSLRPEERFVRLDSYYSGDLKKNVNKRYAERWVKRSVAEEMAKASRFVENQMQYRWNDFNFSTITKINNYWKSMVTTWNFPKYHVGNMMSDGFMNIMDGVRLNSYRKAATVMAHSHPLRGRISQDPEGYAALLRNEMTKDFGSFDRELAQVGDPRRARHVTTIMVNGKPTKLDSEMVFKLYHEYGLGQTQVNGNILRSSSVGPSNLQKFYTKVTDGVLDLSNGREDYFRLAHFIHAIESESKIGRRSMDEIMGAARDRVIKYHFDYGDVSEFERNVVSTVMPFYKWQRNIIPLALGQLFTNPRMYTVSNSANQAMAGIMFPTQEDANGNVIPIDYIAPSFVGDMNLMPIGKYTDPNGNEQARYAVLNLPLDQTIAAWISPIIDPMLDPNLSGQDKAVAGVNNTVSTVLSKTNPFIKAIMESGLGVSPVVGDKYSVEDTKWTRTLRGVAFPNAQPIMDWYDDIKAGKPSKTGWDTVGIIRETQSSEAVVRGTLHERNDEMTAVYKRAAAKWMKQYYPGINPESEEGKKLLHDYFVSTGTLTR